jgi:hypothetical protein
MAKFRATEERLGDGVLREHPRRTVGRVAGVDAWGSLEAS